MDTWGPEQDCRASTNGRFSSFMFFYANTRSLFISLWMTRRVRQINSLVHVTPTLRDTADAEVSVLSCPVLRYDQLLAGRMF